MSEKNQLDISSLKMVKIETLNTSFIPLQCSNMEADRKFILAADNQTKSLLMFNKHLRLVNQVKIKNMLSAFPYIKVKNSCMAFVTNLEDMKYNFMGHSNGFIITRMEV